MEVVHDIAEAPWLPGVLLLATREAGVLTFDLAQGTVTDRYDTTTRPGLASDYAWSVTPSEREPGVLWVATRYGGLARLDIRRGTARLFRGRDRAGAQGKDSDGMEVPCLPVDDVIAVIEGNEDNIWAGTFEGGLVEVLPNEGRCIPVPSHILPFSDPAAIHRDDRGRLWVASGDGLGVYEPSLQRANLYGPADGLQGEEFQYFAHAQTARGELVFGGPGGFHVFDPDTLGAYGTSPDIVITDVDVDGEPVPRPLWEESVLRLSHRQNDVRVAFAVLALRDPSRNRYRVRMEGTGRGWEELGSTGEVRYPALRPGTYAFEVMGGRALGGIGARSQPGADRPRSCPVLGHVVVLVAHHCCGHRHRRRRLSVSHRTDATPRERAPPDRR